MEGDRKVNKRVRCADTDCGGGEHGRLGRFRAGTQGRGSWKAQRHRSVDCRQGAGASGRPRVGVVTGLWVLEGHR